LAGHLSDRAPHRAASAQHRAQFHRPFGTVL